MNNNIDTNKMVEECRIKSFENCSHVDMGDACGSYWNEEQMEEVIPKLVNHILSQIPEQREWVSVEDRWVKVEDRLPDGKKTVYMMHEGKVIEAWFVGDSCGKKVRAFYKHEVIEVTEWHDKTMPNPPNTTKED